MIVEGWRTPYNNPVIVTQFQDLFSAASLLQLPCIIPTNLFFLHLPTVLHIQNKPHKTTVAPLQKPKAPPTQYIAFSPHFLANLYFVLRWKQRKSLSKKIVLSLALWNSSHKKTKKFCRNSFRKQKWHFVVHVHLFFPLVLYTDPVMAAMPEAQRNKPPCLESLQNHHSQWALKTTNRSFSWKQNAPLWITIQPDHPHDPDLHIWIFYTCHMNKTEYLLFYESSQQCTVP